MTFTAMKELTDLPVGGRVVVDDGVDRPWTKVDEEWMDNGEVRLRVRHFSGAVTSGHVSLYDETVVRQWTVRHGGAHYSLALAPDPEHEGQWRCLTFHAANPAALYTPEILSLPPSAMGEYIDEPQTVPWQAFAQALASHHEAERQGRVTEVAAYRTENQRLGALIAEQTPRLRVADNLRAALRTLLAEVEDGEDEDPF